jgi:membrane-bound ClpP family serine protease
MRPSPAQRGSIRQAAVRATGWVVAAVLAAPVTATETVLVPVPLPLTGTRDKQVETAILKRLDRLRAGGAERGVLVLRFDPQPQAADAGEPSDFARALALARFLGDERLAGVKTVAYLPEGATGHAVLVALACEEIAMPADATLGPVTDLGGRVDDTMRAAYAEIAGRRRTLPPAVARALVDPGAEVVKVSTADGEQFVEPDEVAALRAKTVVLEVTDLGPAPLVFTGRRGRELGIVRLLARTPADLARALAVPEAALQADPSLAGGWRPAQVVLAGELSGDAVNRVRTRLDRVIADGANLVCLRIESPGGAPEQSLVLATWLAGLDPAQVRTVAYVPREARGAAALVALACDELVADPRATLGGEGAAAIGERQGEAIVAAWRDGVARVRGRTWSLPVAVAVPGIEVFRGVQQGTGRVDYFSPTELRQRDDRETWQLGAAVGTGPLEVTGRRAEELGLVTHLVDDFAGLRKAYGVEGEVALAEPGWADRLLEALASPGIAWLLLLVGGAGLYIELKTPGVGFGGFVAMVAFLIYFWSQYLHGTSGWLEVMLFLAGLFCLAAEIFVLPGFGVLGLGGGLLVIAALVLASQSFVLPANDYQIRQMQWSLLGILGAFGGTAALALVLRQWLPSTPVLRNVLLVPPEPPAEDVAAQDQFQDLLGAEGVTTSRLAPAGKARVGGAVREVSSDGALIEPGVPVRVVDIRGGRLVVRAV